MFNKQRHLIRSNNVNSSSSLALKEVRIVDKFSSYANKAEIFFNDFIIDSVAPLMHGNSHDSTTITRVAHSRFQFQLTFR